jgi:hypothetical protein
MNNVIRLFARKNLEIVVSDPEPQIATAVTNLLAAGAILEHEFSGLSKHFDATDDAIDRTDDTETRSRLKQSTKLLRDALSKAMLELSQEIREVSVSP